jgi:hypothetical protein
MNVQLRVRRGCRCGGKVLVDVMNLQDCEDDWRAKGKGIGTYAVAPSPLSAPLYVFACEVCVAFCCSVRG